MNLPEVRAQLKTWLEELKRWDPATQQSWDDYLSTEERENPKECTKRTREVLHLTLYTNDHEYRISAETTYLGCIASVRKPRAGETWTRGNDLPSGAFNEDTWRAILQAIVRYELVAKVKTREPTMVEGVSK